MITEKQLKSGLRKCPIHPHQGYYEPVGFGKLECQKCHGFLDIKEVPEGKEAKYKIYRFKPRSLPEATCYLEWDEESKTYGADKEFNIVGET